MNIDKEVCTKTTTELTLTGEDIRAFLIMSEFIKEDVPVEVSCCGIRVDVAEPITVKFEETKYS